MRLKVKVIETFADRGRTDRREDHVVHKHCFNNALCIREANV